MTETRPVPAYIAIEVYTKLAGLPGVARDTVYKVSMPGTKVEEYSFGAGSKIITGT